MKNRKNNRQNHRQGAGKSAKGPESRAARRAGVAPPSPVAAEVEYWLRQFDPAGAAGEESVAATVEEEADLWAQAVRDVRRLTREKAGVAGGDSPDGPARKAKAAGRRAAARREEDEAPGGRNTGGGVARDAAHPGAGLDRRSALKLRRGRMEIEGRIDLHGMNREQAFEALGQFVQQAYAARKRCVLVITGKGRGGQEGVLRRAVPEWVRAGALAGIVLRCVTAQPQDGGGGAYYVLLRRQRD